MIFYARAPFSNLLLSSAITAVIAFILGILALIMVSWSAYILSIYELHEPKSDEFWKKLSEILMESLRRSFKHIRRGYILLVASIILSSFSSISLLILALNLLRPV